MKRKVKSLGLDEKVLQFSSDSIMKAYAEIVAEPGIPYPCLAQDEKCINSLFQKVKMRFPDASVIDYSYFHFFCATRESLSLFRGFLLSDMNECITCMLMVQEMLED